ncbi:MAG TPA: 16S rRNA (guanine(527)-N(7))-methyltransferase RsmG [Allosphingosinicella sp.]|jgi:16S rRNA (guanine527-N7)-methyltransferase|uniref:16S rRNA (guanine(527)-N(7))-methyltransferase RsmG n=1 Tax=Allosphingosinicella sp. TaxID=2823234 RepID=UPI002F2A88DC
MSEDARRILAEQFGVSRETLDRLSVFVDLLARENQHQNLIARGTFGNIWSRHILDSAQLLRFVPAAARTWLDLGTGAGFPGLVVAALHPVQVTMVESRRLRVDFLRRAAETLALPSSTQILCSRVERLELPTQDVISARAFAPLDRLLDLGQRFAAPQTRWVLPKGRNAQSELDAVRSSWQGKFHVEPSLTDPEAGIIIAEQVRRRGRG